MLVASASELLAKLLAIASGAERRAGNDLRHLAWPWSVGHRDGAPSEPEMKINLERQPPERRRSSAARPAAAIAALLVAACGEGPAVGLPGGDAGRSARPSRRSKLPSRAAASTSSMVAGSASSPTRRSGTTRGRPCGSTVRAGRATRVVRSSASRVRPAPTTPRRSSEPAGGSRSRDMMGHPSSWSSARRRGTSGSLRTVCWWSRRSTGPSRRPSSSTRRSPSPTTRASCGSA